MKYINFKRYKFSTIVKTLSKFVPNFLQIFKFINLRRYDFKRIYKYADFKNILKYTDFRKFNLVKNRKYFNFINSKFFLVHLPAGIIFFGFLYLAIPIFYNYDKSRIQNQICNNDNNINCIIKGEVVYRFFPTPRLKIIDLTINGNEGKKITLVKAKKALVKLSFKNLLAKEKHKPKKINLYKYETILDFKKIKKYGKYFEKRITNIPITLKSGKVIFNEGNNYIATINEGDIDLKFNKKEIEAELKGKFLNDNIYLTLNKKNIDNKMSTDLIIKMSNLNFLTKANFFTSEKNKMNGNFLIKKGKNKIAGLFTYKNGELNINKSNLKNIFFDGNLDGEITFLPYFNFDLNLNLNNINFTRLYNYFLSLDEINQKNVFKVNKKINGKLNLSTDKIYSKHNSIKSFESRLNFYNGNVNIEQFLINLGKLGAADVLGEINNDKNLTNLKFESNIFIDNKKKFRSKFGIYRQKNLSPNYFVSGNFDLDNIKTSIYEISGNNKFKSEDIDYIEREFNDLMLENGFNYLFDFQKFKSFLKSISTEEN